jgi:hypothetical protein
VVAPRRRVDFAWLPTWAQYLLGAFIAGVVGAVVWLGGGGEHSAPGWYRLGVKIAAVALLVVGCGWVLRRLFRSR